jgi:hypothetical protein
VSSDKVVNLSRRSPAFCSARHKNADHVYVSPDERPVVVVGATSLSYLLDAAAPKDGPQLKNTTTRLRNNQPTHPEDFPPEPMGLMDLSVSVPGGRP